MSDTLRVKLPAAPHDDEPVAPDARDHAGAAHASPADGIDWAEQDRTGHGSVSRRRMLTFSALSAGMALGVGVGAAEASGPWRRRKSPTDRVAPRPETATEQVDAQVFWRLAPDKPQVALTFDDGPDPQWTPQALDALAEVGAHATFFMLGDAVAQHPELAARVVAEGHEVANHGMGHKDLTDLSIEELRANIGEAHEAIVAATGTAPTLLRPPWGRIDAPGLFVASEFGYRVALWSHHLPTDGADRKVTRNLATASPGMIVLCHDGRSTPADSLFVSVRRLLAGFVERGLEQVPVSEMLARP